MDHRVWGSGGTGRVRTGLVWGSDGTGRVRSEQVKRNDRQDWRCHIGRLTMLWFVLLFMTGAITGAVTEPAQAQAAGNREQAARHQAETPVHTYFDWVGYASIEWGRQTGTAASVNADFTFANGYYALFDMAAYGRGLWAGAYEWTAAYDHAKTRSSRSLDHNSVIYPVLGDASRREYDALSQDPIYISIRKGQNRFLYGDYETGISTELVSFERRLTGPRLDTVVPLGQTGQGGQPQLGISLMGARTKQLPYTDHFPAQGIAGFYRLTHDRIVPRTERVTIVTYDPNHLDEPVTVLDLRRDVDYRLDYVEGMLLFRQPVPVQDIEGHLNYIRVHYEYNPAGSDGMYSSLGARATYLSDGLRLGTTWIDQSGGSVATQVIGADAHLQFSEGLEVRGEVARSRSGIGLDERMGHAYFVEIVGRLDNQGNIRAFYRDVDPAFSTDGHASTSPGQTRLGVEVDVRPSDALLTQIGWERERRFDSETASEENRSLVSAGVVYRMQPWTLSTRIQGGFRYATETHIDRYETLGVSAALDYSFTTGGTIGLSRESEWAKSFDTGLLTQIGSTGIRYQGSIGNVATWALGYTLTDAGDHGAWIGLDRRLYDSDVFTSTLFSRYRIDGPVDSLHGQASVGVANRLQLNRDVSADVHVEVVAAPGNHTPQVIAERVRPEGQRAYSLTLNYAPDAPYTVAAHHSQRSTDRTRTVYTEMTAAGRIGMDVSLFLNGAWTEMTSEDGPIRRQTQSVSLAYRPVGEERLNALFHYERGARQATGSGSPTSERMHEHTVSAEGSFWVLPTLELGLKLAQRHRFEWVPPAARVHSVTDLYQAQSTLEIMPRVDINAVYRRLFQKNTNLFQVGYQASIGYKLVENDPRWLVEAGYRYADYAPEDDPSDDAFVKGPFVRLTYVF